MDSVRAQHQLTARKNEGDKVMQRLASGKRINSAADDAAGLSIASKMNATAHSLDQATRNSMDGLSMVQVAEGGMNETSSILVRLRELAIQSASDTIGDAERFAITREVGGLRDEIDRISQTTEYNGKKLLSGNFSWPTLSIQVGINGGYDEDQLDLNRANLSTGLGHLGLTAIDLSTKERARENLGAIDNAMVGLSRSRASVGAMMSRIETSIANTQVYSENIKGTRSRIEDTDYASEISDATRNKMLADATVSVLAQANQNPNLALKLIS